MAVASRNTRRLRAIKADYRIRRPQPCMRCGQPIDYDAPDNHPNSFDLGHIHSWRDYPELREDPANMQQEHAGCGRAAGTRHGLDREMGMTSGLLG